MRPPAQIRAMCDQVHRLFLINGGEMAQIVLTVLDWACDPLTPDSVVTDLADGLDPDDEPDGDPEAADILHAIPDVARTDDLDDAKTYLARIGEDAVTEIAAAARRLDRLCKKELKTRTPKS